MLKINGYEANYNKLFIYDGENILFETCRPQELNIEIEVKEIRSARKLNFSKNDCFEIKNNTENWRLMANGYNLYIPSSIIDVVSITEKVAMVANGETNYKNEYVLKFNCDAYRWNKHHEKITNIPKDTILSDIDKNGKFSDGYSKDFNTYNFFESRLTGESGLMKKWLTYDKLNKITVDSDYYTRSEKDAGRLERDKIAEIITSCIYSGKTISHYEVERILEKLNITIKEQ